MERLTEVTAEDYNKGLCDFEGINWKNNLLTFRNHSIRLSKSFYRHLRYNIFTNYQDLQWNSKKIQKDITPVRDDGNFYKFRYSKLDTDSAINHFQLRNLLAVPTKNDVYYNAKDSIIHWNPITHESESIFDSSTLNVYSLTASKDLVAFGVRVGNYIICSINNPKIKKYETIPRLNQTGTDGNQVDYAINYMKFITNHTGKEELLIASNDFFCRMTDMTTLKYTYEYEDTKAINCASLRNDGKSLLCVGDSKVTKLIDITSNKEIQHIEEHYDYLFSCEWSPNGRYFVTGGQDRCARLYDFRNMSQSLNVLPMNVSSVRSVRFTDDNQYLAVAEHIDYVHIYDAAGGIILREQVVDFFTEIAGIGFTPGDGHCLYISTVNTNIMNPNIVPTNGILMEFERCRFTRNDIFF
ncbi:WD40 repeat-like protein [Anaeromyces robustus]|uniref:WD40 repeat-like protein n=1 Tax=Anaeromyces robustus TaxID=1754192 RepID=A0A1Y1XLE9_9FUNG|nr:WD40 repeat-like protein [Anaeromyces robustus]|eukprot:ORX86542.1 WD40 repeat-like protein [Anaeromyces robustus]